MKLTVADFIPRERFGERKSFEMIKKAGYDGVDFNLCGFSDTTYMLGDDYKVRAERTKKSLNELGLIVEQSHAPFLFKYGEDFSLENKNYRDIVRAIEYASKIGAKYIIVHAIACPESVDLIEYNINYYNTFLPYAKKFNIMICVENLFNSLNNFDRHIKVIQALDKKYFGACIDVGHCVRNNLDPAEYICRFDRDMIKCIHIQDMDGVNDNHWIPYQGVINWDKVLKALKDYNFKGELNFEIIHCFDHIENELFFDTLSYSEKVGRFMLKKMQNI